MATVRTEASIEKAVCAYAKERGFLTIKLVSARGGVNGWPDRLFISPRGRVIFCEFKREGGKVTLLQSARILELQRHMANAYVVDNVPAGKEMIDEYA